MIYRQNKLGCSAICFGFPLVVGRIHFMDSLPALSTICWSIRVTWGIIACLRHDVLPRHTISSGWTKVMMRCNTGMSLHVKAASQRLTIIRLSKALICSIVSKQLWKFHFDVPSSKRFPKQKIKKVCYESNSVWLYRVNNEDMYYVQGRRLLLVKLATSSLPDYLQTIVIFMQARYFYFRGGFNDFYFRNSRSYWHLALALILYARWHNQGIDRRWVCVWHSGLVSSK